MPTHPDIKERLWCAALAISQPLVRVFSISARKEGQSTVISPMEMTSSRYRATSVLNSWTICVTMEWHKKVEVIPRMTQSNKHFTHSKLPVLLSAVEWCLFLACITTCQHENVSAKKGMLSSTRSRRTIIVICLFPHWGQIMCQWRCKVVAYLKKTATLHTGVTKAH